MKPFGTFLSNLRNSNGLSLSELAILTDSSKSTLSRLENNVIPRPFKTAIRTLIIQLAEVLCSSKDEAERYLSLANIDLSLLTEQERILLGFIPSSVILSLKEPHDLERFERVYEQRLRELPPRIARIRHVPQQLERKIGEYATKVKEVKALRDALAVKQNPLKFAIVQPAFQGKAKAGEDKLIVLNFNHPLTEQQQKQIEELAGRAIDIIITIPTLIDETEPLALQIARLVDATELSLEDWNKCHILINPPGYAPAASLLLAEIHGRMGHFPTLIRLRPEYGSITTYEVIELLNLQSVRDMARYSSDSMTKQSDHVNTTIS